MKKAFFLLPVILLIAGCTPTGEPAKTRVSFDGEAILINGTPSREKSFLRNAQKDHGAVNQVLSYTDT